MNITQKRYKRAKRRHFFLLEVMIAIALITFAALPLLRPYYSSYIAQIDFIKRTRLELLSDNLFLDIHQKIGKRLIPMDDLLNGFHATFPTQKKIYFDTDIAAEYRAEYKIDSTLSFEDIKNFQHYILDITILLKELPQDKVPFTRTYQIYLSPEHHLEEETP